jgi:hypothetical protein
VTSRHLRSTLSGLLLWPLLSAWLTACSSTVTAPEPVIPIASVGEVTLIVAEQTPPDHALLNLGVVIFEVPEIDSSSAVSGESIYQQIASNESHYLPFVLRNALVDSNQWGAVRVLPEADPSLDLTLRGRLIESNGLNLQLAVQVSDSTGREWINKTYRSETSAADYPGPDPFLRNLSRDEHIDAAAAGDPFADIYHQIANDLLALRNTLSREQLEQISLVSEMRYATDISPQTYQRFLVPGADGLLTVSGLPARDDPMLLRIQNIKLRHHVFIDTVDEYYEALHQDMQAPYNLWRRYSRDQTVEDMSAQRRIESQSTAESGSFLALSQSYNRYMWAKLFAQEFMQLAASFNNEVAPAILELNRQVHGLSGPVEEQYGQWREILRQIFELETGLEAAQD